MAPGRPSEPPNLFRFLPTLVPLRPSLLCEHGGYFKRLNMKGIGNDYLMSAAMTRIPTVQMNVTMRRMAYRRLTGRIYR